MNFGPLLCSVFLIIWAVTANSQNETLSSMLLLNGVLQFILFLIVAIRPLIQTGRMSYVDIAWPFGVALIGVQIIWLGDGELLRRACIGGVYLLIGLRMGLGAITMAKKTGVIFKTEFPRYVYRRMEMSAWSETKIRIHMGAEILAQGFANASVLAIPGFVMSINSQASFHPLELLGVGVWLMAYVMESMADLQKLQFMAKHKGGVCNIGLWRYTRHPNYFSEWLVWTGIVIAAVPSWLMMRCCESSFVWFSLGIGGLGASVMLYITLVYLTGAVPSEYYSVRKRPDYKKYQETTNMFFPWFPKN